jgi:hypothetical protein
MSILKQFAIASAGKGTVEANGFLQLGLSSQRDVTGFEY